MLDGLIGKKIGMTQVFSDAGECIPVTVVELGPVTVVQKKAKEIDGYDAVQVGYQEIPDSKLRNINKPSKGHFGDVKPAKHLREFKADEHEKIEVGQKIDLSIFQKDQIVDLVGTSKGKGFAGVIKRWGFSGGPKAHGHRFHRGTGSIGNSATPARVWKNKKMAGHLGNARVTVQGLRIVDIKPELNIVLVSGGIPGPNGRLVEIRRSKKA